jgi:hypothetical protein
MRRARFTFTSDLKRKRGRFAGDVSTGSTVQTLPAISDFLPQVIKSEGKTL